jgi:outer membrane receptor protein involved in Fe transport
MNSTRSGAGFVGARLATLLGSASLLAMAHAGAYAAEQLAQAEEIPETVLITGSLIRGTAAVGVPVTNLTPMDFATVGALTTADLFRTFPAANVSPGAPGTSAGNFVARNTRVNLRGLDTGDGTRSLLMVDGMRYPAQGQGLCMIDPSIIPALALDHIDILVDGASATYGSDAIGGVINIILKRNMDGATTQFRWSTSEGGKNRYLAAAIWGRTWDGGQVTFTYEWYHETPAMGDAHSNFTTDFNPWGFDDRTWLGSATPGILSTGAASQPGGGPNVGTSAALGHGCTNCYAIPAGTGQNWDPGVSGIGPTAPSSGATLNWASFNTAANSGANALRNQFESYDLSWYEPSQERNAAVLTVDQRLTRNISFYGSAFYSNRRAMMWNPGAITPTANAILQGFAVPTFNPYYPTGAPTNLRVYYHLGHEVESMVAAHVLAGRYQMGLNIALPAGWASQVWYAESFDKTAYNTRGTVNKAAISAALGWTIPVTPASGSTPAIATWAKPANVPYLNLFCDPTAYQCNSATTLAYITGVRALDERYKINEKGIKADGPLFDLPGGPVKAAVGATYTTFAFSILSLDNTNATSLVLPYQVNAERRAVWAMFTQLNIPLFSDNNGIPFIRRLELEGSWRHDQYSDLGAGTSNPKVAFNWSPINDFTVRGTWGTSFRAPGPGEISALANVAINGHNLIAQGLAVSPDPIPAGCGPNGELPPVGSAAWKLMSSLGPGGNGAPGSASVCPSGNITIGSHTFDVRRLPGVNIQGGIGAAATIRSGGFNGGPDLEPEIATNWGIGFDYTPSANFLTGLNLQATYYSIKLNGTLRNFGQPNASAFNDPAWGENAVFVPTDWLNSGLPGAAACTSNLLPTTCAPFQNAVNSLLLHPRAQVSPQAQTLIMWLHDSGTVNRGWQKVDGIDFQASYDWEWGEIGAFNTGIIGTYYLHNKAQFAPGAAVIDYLHQTVGVPGVTESEGVSTNPRFRWRARLGWSNGTWSVTAFADYQSHYYHQQTPPPNVNGNFCASNGSLDSLGMGGTFPCAIQDYNNITPSWYSFDLSIGYDTGDRPANEYLRNIGFQFVIQNVLDKHAPFQYKPSTVGGPPSAIAAFGGPGGGVSNAGRVFNLILTKQW